MDQAEAVQDDFIPEEAESVQEEVQVESQEEVEETTEVSDESEESSVTDELIEVEYEGENYKVPPELKDALMRQAAFTQKTQEVAQARKALEEQQQQFQQVMQAQQMNMQGHAQLAALQNQLQQYENVDWNSFSENDPQAAQQAFFQYQQLKDATSNLSQQIQRQEAETLQMQRQEYVKRLEQGKAELARDIPGWSTEKAQQIVSHGESYGFTDSELKSVADPRMVKVLHDAMLYRQSLKKATEKPKSDVKPVSKVKGKAPVAKDPEKMNTEEWLKWRNKQLSQRGN